MRELEWQIRRKLKSKFSFATWLRWSLALNNDDGQRVSDYWASLVEKKFSANAELSSDEQVFYAANILRGSVPRIGLIGYFENTKANVIHDAHQALAMLGLSEVLRLLQEALRIVLNGQPLSESDQCVTFFDYDLPEEELEKAMDDLDEKVSGIQDQL